MIEFFNQTFILLRHIIWMGLFVSSIKKMKLRVRGEAPTMHMKELEKVCVAQLNIAELWVVGITKGPHWLILNLEN